MTGSLAQVMSLPVLPGWATFPVASWIPARTQVIGRGARLHLLTADSWYQLTLPDIPATPGSAGLRESGRK
jgi:hypothetical protein